MKTKEAKPTLPAPSDPPLPPDHPVWSKPEVQAFCGMVDSATTDRPDTHEGWMAEAAGLTPAPSGASDGEQIPLCHCGGFLRMDVTSGRMFCETCNARLDAADKLAESIPSELFDGDSWRGVEEALDAYRAESRYSEPFPTGASLIAEERREQFVKHRRTLEQDDTYKCDELTRAAFCYLLENIAPWTLSPGEVPENWPWPKASWRPSTPIRNLVKAGALIAAEIDRLQRAALIAERGEGKLP